MINRKRSGNWRNNNSNNSISLNDTKHQKCNNMEESNQYDEIIQKYYDEQRYFLSMGFPVHLHSRNPFHGTDYCASSSVRSYAGFSMPGYYPQNTTRSNQDSLLMMEDPRTKSIVFVCMDGHGTNGHKVSQFVRKHLEDKLCSHPLFSTDIANAIRQVLLDIEHQLSHLKEKFAESSGTTLSMAVIRGDHVTVANIGDSRTVLMKCMPACDDSITLSSDSSSNASSPIHRINDTDFVSSDSERSRTMSTDSDISECGEKERSTQRKLSAVSLTVDHKPDRVEEYNRILASGGRVFSIRYADGVVGPPRVWHSDVNSPGLAMSRSIGDLRIQAAGVTSLPDIFEYSLNLSEDSILVLATDGLWDKLNNEEVGALVDQHCDPNRAVANLIDNARKKWLSLDHMSDDISVCVAYLRSNC